MGVRGAVDADMFIMTFSIEKYLLCVLALSMFMLIAMYEALMCVARVSLTLN